jgi:hypothetical protein
MTPLLFQFAELISESYHHFLPFTIRHSPRVTIPRDVPADRSNEQAKLGTGVQRVTSHPLQVGARPRRPDSCIGNQVRPARHPRQRAARHPNAAAIMTDEHAAQRIPTRKT